MATVKRSGKREFVAIDDALDVHLEVFFDVALSTLSAGYSGRKDLISLNAFCMCYRRRTGFMYTESRQLLSYLLSVEDTDRLKSLNVLRRSLQPRWVMWKVMRPRFNVFYNTFSLYCYRRWDAGGRVVAYSKIQRDLLCNNTPEGLFALLGLDVGNAHDVALDVHMFGCFQELEKTMYECPNLYYRDEFMFSDGANNTFICVSYCEVHGKFHGHLTSPRLCSLSVSGVPKPLRIPCPGCKPSRKRMMLRKESRV